MVNGRSPRSRPSADCQFFCGPWPVACRPFPTCFKGAAILQSGGQWFVVRGSASILCSVLLRAIWNLKSAIGSGA